MEEVYPRDDSRTTQPEMYCRKHGRGRVVYFPFDIDRTFWEVLSPDHLKLMRNAVAWAGGGAHTPVHVTGQGVLDVTYWRQKDSLTVHLVNLTNPMFMKGPVREIIPLGPQRVRIELPSGFGAREARLLTLGRTAKLQTLNGRVELEVPSIGLHEVIALQKV
jgi:hypothetical protein